MKFSEKYRIFHREKNLLKFRKLCKNKIQREVQDLPQKEKSNFRQREIQEKDRTIFSEKYRIFHRKKAFTSKFQLLLFCLLFFSASLRKTKRHRAKTAFGPSARRFRPRPFAQKPKTFQLLRICPLFFSASLRKTKGHLPPLRSVEFPAIVFSIYTAGA